MTSPQIYFHLLSVNLLLHSIYWFAFLYKRWPMLTIVLYEMYMQATVQSFLFKFFHQLLERSFLIVTLSKKIMLWLQCMKCLEVKNFSQHTTCNCYANTLHPCHAKTLPIPCTLWAFCNIKFRPCRAAVLLLLYFYDARQTNCPDQNICNHYVKFLGEKQLFQFTLLAVWDISDYMKWSTLRFSTEIHWLPIQSQGRI